MGNKNTLYRRQTKNYQRNAYRHLYGIESQSESKKLKYFSMLALFVPAVLVLISFLLRNTVMTIISMILWIICIVIVFTNANKKQKEFVVKLKKSGMPRNEFIRQMKTRTKNQTQLNKYIKIWDETENPKKNGNKRKFF